MPDRSTQPFSPILADDPKLRELRLRRLELRRKFHEELLALSPKLAEIDKQAQALDVEIQTRTTEEARRRQRAIGRQEADILHAQLAARLNRRRRNFDVSQATARSAYQWFPPTEPTMQCVPMNLEGMTAGSLLNQAQTTHNGTQGLVGWIAAADGTTLDFRMGQESSDSETILMRWKADTNSVPPGNYSFEPVESGLPDFILTFETELTGSGAILEDAMVEVKYTHSLGRYLGQSPDLIVSELSEQVASESKSSQIGNPATTSHSVDQSLPFGTVLRLGGQPNESAVFEIGISIQGETGNGTVGVFFWSAFVPIPVGDGNRLFQLKRHD